MSFAVNAVPDDPADSLPMLDGFAYAVKRTSGRQPMGAR